MNIILHLIILFIFVFALLMFNFPQLVSKQHIRLKLYIFAGIFIFEFIIGLTTAIYKKCVIDFSNISRNSLYSALLGVVAYSMYTDLVFASNPWVLAHDDEVSRNLTISVFVTIAVAANYLFEFILSGTTPKVNDCLNTIYPQHKN